MIPFNVVDSKECDKTFYFVDYPSLNYFPSAEIKLYRPGLNPLVDPETMTLIINPVSKSMWFFQQITQYGYVLTHTKIPANSAGKWIIKISTSLNQYDNYVHSLRLFVQSSPNLCNDCQRKCPNILFDGKNVLD